MFKKTTLLAGACLLAASAWSQTDSTYIYLCATDNGESGLVMSQAKSLDKPKWKTDGLSARLTSSDFGPWGPGKKMYHPQVFHDESTGTWHLIFFVDKGSTTAAYTTSTNLIDWTVQEYRHAADAMDMIPSTARHGIEATYKYKGNDAHGVVFKVPTALVDRIKAHQHYLSALDARNNERCAEDAWRFQGIDTVSLTILPHPQGAKPISDKFIGIFFEDINYAADGGLYAELIQNRDFEYSHTERLEPRWTHTKAWSLSDSTKISSKILTDDPLHANNTHYIRLTSTGGKASLVNEGYDGIAVKCDDIYNVSMFVRSAKRQSTTVALTDADGRQIGRCVLKGNTPGAWSKVSGQIKAKATCDNARLTITPAAGQTDLDMVSLMPEKTFKGRPNGLRPDLAQALADLKPRFVRFPGGCVAHGDGIDNMYDWKGSIGPLEQRTGMRNLWGYHQTRGLGYHEYFLLCEDLGAEPLPVLAAGVPCQNSSHHSHVSHDLLTTHGQQCGIPMDEMPAYISDILDLIEYANGDASTPWGAHRAEAGHPEPFNLKMIGIGNEDLITEAFKERFLMIFNAIKDRYPDIEVVGTVGPFHEGSDYEAGWQLAREHSIPAVDEHYYVSPGWFIHNADFYDSYDRDGTKVYLGEYASHVPGRASSLEAALSVALYLTNVERNADVVTMTSYAPLFAKQNHTQWRPDLIYFNNTDVTLTPDYYVQKMYGNNAGTTYVPADRVSSTNNADLNMRLGSSIVIDSDSGDTIVRLVNMTPATVETTLPYSGQAIATVLAGQPDDTDARETTSTVTIAGDGLYVQPPYSFTVLRFKNLE